MKKIAIILLAAFILAISVCACESLDAGNSGINRETDCITSIYETISRSITSSEITANDITSYRSSIKNRILGSQYFNLIDIIENKSYTVGNWNLEFGLPAREVDMVQNRQPEVQNSQPVFRR